MGNERSDRREELRGRLTDVAEALIAEKGVQGLKAREVTAGAGCALGALYNAVEDLDHLVMRVNARTLARLHAALLAASGDTPTARLQAQARAWTDFARDEPMLWAALFDHRPPPGMQVPDWIEGAQEALLRLVADPLAELFPELEPGALMIRARTFFGAVQGAVQLALTDRFVALPRASLDAELSAMVAALARGFRA